MYNLKIINSGEGIELYYSPKYVIEGHKRGKKVRQYKSDSLKEAMQRKYKIDNLNKSRNKLIRLIKNNTDLGTFITLTYSYKTTVADSKKDLAKFFAKLKRKNKELKYIWVLEFQENGNPHYHILCNLEFDIKVEYRKSFKHKNIENEFNSKFWNKGFIDIKKIDDNSYGVGRYLTSYITKDLTDKDFMGRIYGYSRNLDKPMVTKIIECCPIDELLRNFPGYEIKYSSNYGVGYKQTENMTYMELVKIDKSKDITK